MTQIPFFCGRDCGGDACPLLATVEDGRVTRISNNPAAGRYLKGCRRGFAQAQMQSAPDRLLQPLIRVGPRGSGEFRPASWEEALDLTAERLGDIHARYGAQSILNLSCAGDTGAFHATYAQLGRFLNCWGGSTYLTGSYSNAAASYALPYVLGKEWTVAGFDPATLQDAQQIVLWGANPLDTRLGCEIPQRLVEAHQRGARIIVIDPRRTSTVAHLADEWLAIRPGSDTALLLAVLYVLIREERIDRTFIAAHSVGFDQLEAYILGTQGTPAHDPVWAAALCGIPAADIERFARQYVSASPTLLLPGYSIQRVYAGEETFRLTVALQIATGNFGVRGGSTGAINSRLPVPRIGRLPVPNLPDQPNLPVQRWPDAVLQGRAGGYPSDIHAIYAVGSNFINQGSDSRKSASAFQSVDFAVCHDFFLTATARFCDVVFPAAGPLEKEEIGIPWAGNYVLYRPQILAPRGQARSDYDILCALADRLGFLTQFSENRTTADWIQKFIDQSEIADAAAFRSSGIYFGADQSRVGLADFTTDPQAHPLSTPSGLVEIASATYQQDTGFPAIPTWREAPQKPQYPLSLVTPQSARFTHSQGWNIPALRDGAAHALEMHPQDAEARGISADAMVRIYNNNGVCHIPVRLTENVRPGVVCLEEGAWLNWDVHGVDQGGSANQLTDTAGTPPSTGCIMHAVPVEVALA